MSSKIKISEDIVVLPSCVIYFYGFDCCNGFWENNELCLIYPKAYVGTDVYKRQLRESQSQ